jgi:CheY-like chemotaxis protein/anti-sigma regulatory factor (Ser/Thr protein kinase)
VVTRVLLVDDVVHMRVLVRTALRVRGGFEVVAEAGDGAEAVSRTAELLPDVVVLDLGLPDIAGREVLSQIREVSPRTKVVIFSGAEPTDEQWDAAVAGYVRKGEAIDLLLDVLQSVDAPQAFEAELQLPGELTSVRLARRFVAARLEEWGFEELLDDALLVTSELAANAITHAESACRIRVSRTPSSVRIDVIDAGSGTPEPRPPSFTAEHGRGLHLVDAITSAWGLDDIPGDGKVVWAELARPA